MDIIGEQDQIWPLALDQIIELLQFRVGILKAVLPISLHMRGFEGVIVKSGDLDIGREDRGAHAIVSPFLMMRLAIRDLPAKTRQA